MEVILTAWVGAAVLMSLAWGLARYFNNHAWIDVFWGAVIATIASVLTNRIQPSVMSLFFLVAVWVWGLRLALYLLFKRVFARQVEKRYEAVVEASSLSSGWALFVHVQCQALVACAVACPFYFIVSSVSGYLFGFFGALCVVLGTVGEVVSDYQLAAFKRHHPQGVCDVGLWAYSRHPNYASDLLVWFGFACAGLGASWGWLGLCSPLLLGYVMLHFTIPVTESASLASRGASYRRYQDRVPVLFPFIARKR